MPEEGAAGRGQLRKASSQASQAGADGTGLWAFFLKTHTHVRTSTHAHTCFPISPAFPLCLFSPCWPCSHQKVQGGPLPGQPSGEEAGGRALQPSQKSSPSQGLSGQAPAPPAGPWAQQGDTGQLSHAFSPTQPCSLLQHPQASLEMFPAQSW